MSTKILTNICQNRGLKLVVLSTINPITRAFFSKAIKEAVIIKKITTFCGRQRKCTESSIFFLFWNVFVQQKLTILDDNIKNKVEPTDSSHSAPYFAMRHSF